MKRPKCRRHMLAAIGERGPLTAWAASEGLLPYQRENATQTMRGAEELGLVTRAGLGGARGASPLFALTPEGCAWLDEQEAEEAMKGAAE